MRSGRTSASSIIGAKVAHVRRARQERPHCCHWPGCGREVEPARWGCREHWFKLPVRIRRKLWATYRIGQEELGNASASYLEAAREAEAWVLAQRRATQALRGAAELSPGDVALTQVGGETRRVRVLRRNDSHAPTVYMVELTDSRESVGARMVRRGVTPELSQESLTLVTADSSY